MTDFTKILEKAKELEKKMRESQENLKKIEVNGVSGGDSITIFLNGEGEMTKILLSDRVLEEDKEIIQDLIIAAHNDAKNKLKSKTSEEISKATGGLGVPGFKWPL
ncbi:30S ribosomal protein S21 [Pelagibacteraceae bacterium GOM-A4]|nr:30S ribosomal protein S21 [Pelagibacteraceae bacterium GOM-A4]